MDIEKFNKKLEEERKILIEELRGLGRRDPANDDWEATPEEGDPEADPNDQADRAEDFEERTAMLNTLEKRLREVDLALSKIKGGNYGTCEVCGKEIEKDRLEANPAAKTCKEHMS